MADAGQWEIAPSVLQIGPTLGKGAFGLLHGAKLHLTDVVVRDINEAPNLNEREFISEARLMAGFLHDNLLKVHGVCIQDRPLKLVTEYMPCGTLKSYLENETNREQLRGGDPKILQNICRQVCDGMAYLEAKNFVHGNLTLRNCFVGPNDVVKVADFGLAQFRPDLIEWISARANIDRCSIAPEVLVNGMFTHESDMWDFGLIIWETFLYGRSRYTLEKCREIRHQRVPGWGCTDRAVYKTVVLCCDTRDSVRPKFAGLGTRLDAMV